MPPSGSSASTLPALLETTQTLLSRFQSTLSTTKPESNAAAPPHPNTSNDPTPPADPSSTLSDSARLLKAHATKLGLLLLNAPFTPSAVVQVLSEITATCLPAMMSAVELLGARRGACVEKEVRMHVGAVVAAVGEMVKDAERVSQGEGAGKSTKSPQQQKQSDSTLASTGQVWSACDKLVTLAAASPADIVVRKAEEYRSLLRDAIDELKEWAEDEDEGFDDGEAGDEDSDVQFGLSRCPRDKPELRAQVEATVKRLKLIEIGMKALSKRRLAAFPSEESCGTAEEEQAHGRVKRLDAVMDLLRKIPDEADELAAKFYDLNSIGAAEQLQQCYGPAVKAVELVKNGWDGKPLDDQDRAFAGWVEKWVQLVQQH